MEEEGVVSMGLGSRGATEADDLRYTGSRQVALEGLSKALGRPFERSSKGRGQRQWGTYDILATHLLGSGSQAVVYVGSYVSSGRRDADSGKNACMARVGDIYNRDDGRAGEVGRQARGLQARPKPCAVMVAAVGCRGIYRTGYQRSGRGEGKRACCARGEQRAGQSRSNRSEVR